MLTYAIQFKDTDRSKIDRLLEFVRSLDFVQSVENLSVHFQVDKQVIKTAPKDGYLEATEIRALFPDEWVLLDNPRTEGLKILGGTVLVHDADKRKMALQAREIFKEHKNLLHFFTGETPRIAKIGTFRKLETA